MGMVNPSINAFSGETVTELLDRRAQVAYTTAAVSQGESVSNSWTTTTFPGGSNGQLPSVHFVTSATINNRGTTSGGSTGPAGKLRVHVSHVTLAQTTNCRLFCVFSNSAFTDGDTPTGDYAGFRYSTNVPDTNWQCITNNNSGIGVTDSGVAVSTNEVLLSVTYNTIAATPSCRFYINRNLVAVRTASLPRTSLSAYCWRVFLTTLEGATKEVDVSFLTERYHTI